MLFLDIYAPILAPSGNEFQTFSILWEAVFLPRKILQTRSKLADKYRRYNYLVEVTQLCTETIDHVNKVAAICCYNRPTPP